MAWPRSRLGESFSKAYGSPPAYFYFKSPVGPYERLREHTLELEKMHPAHRIADRDAASAALPTQTQGRRADPVLAGLPVRCGAPDLHKLVFRTRNDMPAIGGKQAGQHGRCVAFQRGLQLPG